MNIIYLDFALNRGGAEVSLEHLISALNPFYRQVVYAPTDTKLTRECIDLEHLECNNKIFNIKRFSPFSLFAVIQLIVISRRIDRKGIIVSNTYKAHITGMALKLLFKRKWVLIERDIAENRAEKIMKRILYHIADRTVFVSNFCRYTNGGKGIVIHNIIKICRNDEKKKYILYAGDFTRDKGFDRIIDIMDSPVHQSAMKFAVMGKVPEYSNEHFEIPGHVEHIDYNYNPYSILRKTAAILMLNRKAESFSRVTAEAMACGAIPIVIKGNGMDDYVKNGKNGIVLDLYDRESVYSEIGKLFSNENIRKRLSANAINSISHFNENNAVIKWKEMFSEMI